MKVGKRTHTDTQVPDTQEDPKDRTIKNLVKKVRLLEASKESMLMNYGSLLASRNELAFKVAFVEGKNSALIARCKLLKEDNDENELRADALECFVRKIATLRFYKSK
jgi:hypothetical protein